MQNPLCTLAPMLRELGSVMKRDERARRPADGSFAFIEHVWHLADLEVEAHGVRITRLLCEDDPLLPDFDGDRAARERDYRARDWRAGLERFARARAANVERVANASARDLARGGTQELVGRIVLRDLPHMMLAHDAAHAGELAALLRDTLARDVPAALSALARAGDVRRTPCRVRASVCDAGRLSLAQLRRWLRGARYPTIDAAARVLHMSPRTLQRRLAARRLTFQCLLDEVRAELALAALATGGSTDDVAEWLGYSDRRAFLRAFKRWTGASPTAHRVVEARLRARC